MEYIVAAWNMEGFAIDAIEALAIGLVVVEVLVGRKVDNCP
jgi:hypothetical protein